MFGVRLSYQQESLDFGTLQHYHRSMKVISISLTLSFRCECEFNYFFFLLSKSKISVLILGGAIEELNVTFHRNPKYNVSFEEKKNVENFQRFKYLI